MQERKPKKERRIGLHVSVNMTRVPVYLLMPFLTVNFLHKKPAEQRIREYILQLSQNRNTAFGSCVSQFESSTKHEANLSYQQLLSNVRNHIDSIRDKLLTDHHKELVEHGMKVIYAIKK